MKYANFKKSVPLEVQEKVFNLVDGFCFYEQRDTSKESLGCYEFSEIQGNHVSGWIPLQDGGFEARELFTISEDPITHFTDLHSKKMQEVYNEIESLVTQDIAQEGMDNEDFYERMQEYEEGMLDYPELTFRAYVKNNQVIVELILEYYNIKEILNKIEFSFYEFIKVDIDQLLERFHY